MIEGNYDLSGGENSNSKDILEPRKKKKDSFSGMVLDLDSSIEGSPECGDAKSNRLDATEVNKIEDRHPKSSKFSEAKKIRFPTRKLFNAAGSPRFNNIVSNRYSSI